jgi:hypothetical protein
MVAGQSTILPRGPTLKVRSIELFALRIVGSALAHALISGCSP